MSPITAVPQNGRSRHLPFSRSPSPALSDDDLDAITPATEAEATPLSSATRASPLAPQLESYIPFTRGSTPELELDYLYRRYSMLGGQQGLGILYPHQGTEVRRISSSCGDEEWTPSAAEKRRPSFDPAEGEDIDNEHLWLRMLAIQRRFHCYNSARMSAALEDDAVKAIVRKFCVFPSFLSPLDIAPLSSKGRIVQCPEHTGTSP